MTRFGALCFIISFLWLWADLVPLHLVLGLGLGLDLGLCLGLGLESRSLPAVVSPEHRGWTLTWSLWDNQIPAQMELFSWLLLGHYLDFAIKQAWQG